VKLETSIILRIYSRREGEANYLLSSIKFRKSKQPAFKFLLSPARNCSSYFD